MGIGNSYAEVEAAYKKDIDSEATDKTQITVGSIYGGIIFSFKNDKVNKVFVGAEAELPLPRTFESCLLSVDPDSYRD